MKAIHYLALLCGGFPVQLTCQAKDKPISQPNIILLMADDLGWGDVGFNGNKVIKTPALNQMASDGIVFDRFYAGSAVCSPTRGSCITGRNPFRYGIYFANVGMMKKEEITIAEVARKLGYTTAHFGKWHLGTLSNTISDGRRGGSDNVHSPPWENGFDECFSTEQAVPTWDPMKNQEIKHPSRYWTGPEQFASENLEGDDSRVMMDRVLPFIGTAVRKNTPFLAVVWFHAPHSPVVAGPEYLKMYPQYDENKQHYYGCITALDKQVARLRKELKELNIEDNTLITFCSDNGPAGIGGGTKQIAGERQQGETGGFRGRKGVLYEGGLRVPGIMIWPAKIKSGQHTQFPAVTSDYFTTILAIWGFELPKRPYDGIDLMPAINGKMAERPGFIGFQIPTQQSIVTQNYKLITPDKKEFELYNLINDKYEQKNIAAANPDLVEQMEKELFQWIESCKNSNEGADYHDDKD
jgi:arylsulfatase A-like enzyme